MPAQAALPFLQAAAIPSVTGGAAAASLAGTGLTIGGAAGAGAGAFAPGAIKAFGQLPASLGFKGLAGGAKAAGAGGLMNLFKTPKGLAAFGQGIGATLQIGGLLMGGEKGRDIAKQGAMFQMISGLAPDISDAISAFKDPNTGTSLEQLGINSGADKYMNSIGSEPLPGIYG